MKKIKSFLALFISAIMMLNILICSSSCGQNDQNQATEEPTDTDFTTEEKPLFDFASERVEIMEGVYVVSPTDAPTFSFKIENGSADIHTAKVILDTYDFNRNAQFHIAPTEDGFYTISPLSCVGKYLSSGGAEVSLSKDPSSPAAQWYFIQADGGYAILNRASNQSLKTKDATLGASVGTEAFAGIESCQSFAFASAYSAYTGMDYTKLTTDENRLAALDKAKAMATVLWVAPFDFVTWCSSKGSYYTVTAEIGTKSTKFLKGKIYAGVPYSMINHSYDDLEWLDAQTYIKEENMSAHSYYSHKIPGTAIGTDCSYFVYICYKAMSIAYALPYQTTSNMLIGTHYQRLSDLEELEPADVLLKNGHVMLFVGKTENGLYAVFEATAVGSKCRYYEYTYDEICQYQPYRMKGLVG